MNRLILLVSIVVLTACSASKQSSDMATTVADDKQAAKEFDFEYLSLKLVNLSMDGELYKAKDVEVTLHLDLPGKSYSGKAACNSFFGSLEVIGEDAIKFLPGGSTEMMCEAEAMQWQARVFNALIGHTFNVTNRKDNATLTQVDGSIMLAFEKVESIQE